MPESDRKEGLSCVAREAITKVSRWKSSPLGPRSERINLGFSP